MARPASSRRTSTSCAPMSSQTPPTSSSRDFGQAVQLVMAELRKGAIYIELLGVEDGALSMSEQVQARARSRGMMPIHPARPCTTVQSSRAEELLGPAGVY